MKIVTSSQMKNADRNTTLVYGIPSVILMENAASECVNIILDNISLDNKKIVVICGGGNNGGDGLAIARKLFLKGLNVKIFKAFDEDKLTDESKQNYDIVLKVGVPFTESLRGFDVVIEALLGIGITGDVREKERKIINKINSLESFVVSVDVPAGICADSGKICGSAVKADLTITIGYGKTGLYTGKGLEYSGKKVVADIGLVPDNESNFFYLDKIPEEWKVKNSILAHKGDNGNVLIVAGSLGMTGAAYLTAMGAHRAGAGIVRLLVPQNLNEIMEKKLTETITIPINRENYFDETCFDTVMNTPADVIVIGPGIGRNEQTISLVHKIIKNSSVPVICDADGIYALSLNINVLKEAKAPVVITPHQGEFSRLLGKPVSEIENNRIGFASDFAKNYNVTVVLKGAGTVIAEPDGNVYINSTGNEGMAKGGSGDVLSGIIGGLCGKKYSHYAACGAYIHGLAGDKAAEVLGKDAMLPTDILNYI